MSDSSTTSWAQWCDQVSPFVKLFGLPLLFAGISVALLANSGLSLSPKDNSLGGDISELEDIDWGFCFGWFQLLQLTKFWWLGSEGQVCRVEVISQPANNATCFDGGAETFSNGTIIGENCQNSMPVWLEDLIEEYASLVVEAYKSISGDIQNGITGETAISDLNITTLVFGAAFGLAALTFLVRAFRVYPRVSTEAKDRAAASAFYTSGATADTGLGRGLLDELPQGPETLGA